MTETEKETAAARDHYRSSDEFAEFVDGFIDAMLWAEPACDFTDDPDDDTSFESAGFSRDDLTESARDTVLRSCHDFFTDQVDDLADYADNRSHNRANGTVWEHAGHDFYLSAAGHGTGFWDRGLGELGDRLHAAAGIYGDVNPYATSTDPDTAKVELYW